MAVNPLSTWRTTFNALVPISDVTWVTPFACWTDDEVTNLLELAVITNGVFTFNKAIFITELTNNAVITLDLDAAMQVFVDAWETAVLASTMVVTGGAGFGKTDIQATGTATNTATVKATLKSTLVGGDLTNDSNTSIFPPAFRTAFLSLNYLVVGDSINPSPPPARIAFSENDGTQ